jgi:hypothetical protein
MARNVQQIRDAFPYSNDCFEMQKTIDKVINEKSYEALKASNSEVSLLNQRLAELERFFEKSNCSLVLGNSKMQQVGDVVSKYNEIDRIRIEAESDAEVKKRILIGASVLLAGVGIVLIVNRK